MKILFQKAERHPNWRGDKASHAAIHTWLANNYGPAKTCEGEDCRKISQKFDYALLKGQQHSHNRDHYIQLCRSCHMRYDLTPDRRRKIMENLSWIV